MEKYHNEELDRPERETKSYKVKKKHVEYVLKLLNNNPTWSIKLLWENTTKTYFDDFEISQSQLSELYGIIMLLVNGQEHDIIQKQLISAPECVR